jgi:hypothetical protein
MSLSISLSTNAFTKQEKGRVHNDTAFRVCGDKLRATSFSESGRFSSHFAPFYQSIAAAFHLARFALICLDHTRSRPGKAAWSRSRFLFRGPGQFDVSIWEDLFHEVIGLMATQAYPASNIELPCFEDDYDSP